MRKASVILAAAALMFSATAMATEGKRTVKAPETKIAVEIGDLLKDNNIVLEDNQELAAYVRFTVNDQNELVVLSVRTDDQKVESFLKAKLNYKDVSTSGLQKGGTYEVPIRFTS